MAKKIINIRLEEAVWQKAKINTAVAGLTLQDYLTLLILKDTPNDKVEVKSE